MPPESDRLFHLLINRLAKSVEREMEVAMAGCSTFHRNSIVHQEIIGQCFWSRKKAQIVLHHLIPCCRLQFFPSCEFVLHSPRIETAVVP